MVKRDGMYHYKRCELPTKHRTARNDTHDEPEEATMHAVQSTKDERPTLDKVCDRMANDIKRLRENAQALMADADSLENELLVVMDLAQEREKQLEEFRQLKALMKKIGSGD